ncbi:MAG: efflux RND transporter periplasmic adaptor subunit [Polyangiaceae bacterium]
MPDQLSTDLSALRLDRAPAPQPRGGALKTTLILLVAAAGAVGAYSLGRPYLEAKFFKTEVELTEVAVVSPAQASVELTSSGYVVPQTLAKVSAKVGGKVSKSNVRQGQPVKAGELLFEVDPIDLNASIASSASQAAAARARAQASRATSQEIEIQAKRARALAEEGVAPRSNAEDLEARVSGLKEQTKAMDAEARAAAALVSALRVNLTSFTVMAPISGTVVNKPPEVGEFVGPQPAGVAVDMGGVEIADYSSMMVETDVPEQRLGLIKMGGPCEIVLDAFPTRRFRGKAHSVSPKADRAKATVTVKVAFADDTNGVLPEMAARVSFLSSEVDAAAIKAPPKVVIPSNALATVNGRRVVYMVDDGKVHVTPITLGPTFGSGFELVKGPPAGSKLVKEPPSGLANGQAIKEKAPG